uniref:Uncharacterized protein n=1 Tax=Tanacetum cinerariifolium TaxID=118510 RepID=A0A6L2N6H9_TANCI|nr:hypothetical protein [Tanacetum cinerariifolium]
MRETPTGEIVISFLFLASNDSKGTEYCRYECFCNGVDDVGWGVPETVDEDKRIATKLNRLREEMLVVCEKRRNLVDELRSIREIVVVGEAAEFVSDNVRKDNAQVEQLREIESQMEFRALEKDLHVQKIIGNGLVMASLPKCKALHERVARRISVLYREMEIAYGEKLDFIWELEVVPCVVVVAKTTEFLNNKL